MPTRLTILNADGEEFFIDVPDDTLIMDGDYNFLTPDRIQTVAIAAPGIQFNFKPHLPPSRAAFIAMNINVLYVYRVINTEPQSSVEYPNPNVIEAIDPTNGQCLCGITCLGTELAFVKVYSI